MALPRSGRKRLRSPEEVRALCLRCSLDALQVLLDLMKDEELKPEVRIRAAESLLDRGCGKGNESTGTMPSVLRFEGALEEWSR